MELAAADDHSDEDFIIRVVGVIVLVCSHLFLDVVLAPMRWLTAAAAARGVDGTREAKSAWSM